MTELLQILWWWWGGQDRWPWVSASTRQSNTRQDKTR